MKYEFENLKKNIFLIHFYNNKEIIKSLLIKFSYIETNGLNICKEYYNNNIVSNSLYHELFEKCIYHKIFRNFNIYDDLLIEINCENNLIQFNINIDNLIDSNIIKYKYIAKFLHKRNPKKMVEFIVLIHEYDKNKITIYDHINSLDVFDIKSNIFDNILNKLFIIHNELNLIHGDLKMDNLLFNNNNITFIDLEFSIFIKKYELRTIREIDLINYYLLLNDNFIISCNFLRLFDIYLLTLSFFISNKIDENHYFKHKMENEINKKLLKNHQYSDYFIQFFIIFDNIYKYFSNKKIYSYDNINIYYEISSYENILNILSLYDNSYENFPIINNNLQYIDNIFKELDKINM